MEGSLFHYPVITRYPSIEDYNNKKMQEKAFAELSQNFLINSLDGLIVSDPGDSRLIIFDSYYCYHSVITNGNQIDFKPSRTAIDPYGHLHVSNPAQKLYYEVREV